MLSNSQVEALIKFGGLQFRKIGPLYTGVFLHQKTSQEKLVIPYDSFKSELGLPDLRMHWALNESIYIAGGSVLSWIDGINNIGDIDFFFKDKETLENFSIFIQGFGFVKTRSTTCADTYSHKDGVIIQLVGANNDQTDEVIINWDHANNGYADFNPFGSPHQIIDSFDIKTCQFAASADNIFTNSEAILNLIIRNLSSSSPDDRKSISRIFKYSRKGYFITDYENFKYEPKRW